MTLPMIPDPWATMVIAVSNTALVVGIAGCLIFVIFYHRLSRWQDSALGRNVMYFMVCLLLLVGVGFARAFLDTWLDHWLEVLRLAAYGLTAAVVWHRVYLLLRYQLGERRERVARENRADARDARADAHEVLADARDTRAEARELRYDERDRRTEGTPPEGVPTPRE